MCASPTQKFSREIGGNPGAGGHPKKSGRISGGNPAGVKIKGMKGGLFEDVTGDLRCSLRACLFCRRGCNIETLSTLGEAGEVLIRAGDVGFGEESTTSGHNSRGS